MTQKRALPTERVDFSPRLAHLEDLAQDEGITIAPESRADLDLLTSRFPPQASAQLVLTDDGHLRVVWQDQEGNHAALRLLGHGKVRYVLFRPDPHGGPTTRTSGDAPMEEAVRMARSMGIPAFPEQHEPEDLPPEIVDTLTGIAALPQDWNSYGASPNQAPRPSTKPRELVRKGLDPGTHQPRNIPRHRRRREHRVEDPGLPPGHRRRPPILHHIPAHKPPDRRGGGGTTRRRQHLPDPRQNRRELTREHTRKDAEHRARHTSTKENRPP